MKRSDFAFVQRTILLLVTAMADRNYSDAEILVAALAREYGIKTPAI